MITVNLPGLVAGRDMADDIVDKLGRLAGETVILEARNLVRGTPAFASRMVERILRDGGAAELAVVGAPDQFEDYLRQAAEEIKMAGRLTLTRRGWTPTVGSTDPRCSDPGAAT